MGLKLCPKDKTFTWAKRNNWETFAIPRKYKLLLTPTTEVNWFGFSLISSMISLDIFMSSLVLV